MWLITILAVQLAPVFDIEPECGGLANPMASPKVFIER